MFRVQVLRGIVVVLFLALAPIAQAAGEDQAAIIDRLDSALNRGDVDGAVAFFTQDAVVIHVATAGASPRVFVGRDQLRWWLQTLVVQHVRLERAGLPLRADSTSLDWQGSVGLDSLRQLGIDSLPTRSSATIDNGELSSLTIVPTAEAARRLANMPGTTGAQLTGQLETPSLAARLNAPDLSWPLAPMAALSGLGALAGFYVRRPLRLPADPRRRLPESM